ncbi:MAG: hypothetical protein IPQ04_03360 [Saprospiraceae bacterium]|nr:hypothetical protein [Saprospiraceae bacterium]
MALTYKNCILIAIYFTLVISSAFSQERRLMIYPTDVIKKKMYIKSTTGVPFNETATRVKGCLDYFLPKYFVGIENFSVVDRKNYDIIQEEKNKQKSEDFIDGYIVEQGKNQGADFVIYPLYKEQEKVVQMKMLDVKLEKIVYLDTWKIDIGLLTGNGKIESQLKVKMSDFVFHSFGYGIPVVKILEEKSGKAELVLIKGGQKNLLNNEDKLDICIYEEIKVENATIYKKKNIGKGELKNVNAGDFSEVEIDSGKKEIFEYLNKGKKVYVYYSERNL